MDELKRLQIALGKSHIAVYEWDMDSNTISWSGNVYETLKLSPSVRNAMKVASKSGYISLIHIDDSDDFTASVAQSSKNGGEYSRTYRICPSDGKEITVTDKGVVVTDGDKKLMVGTVSPVATTTESTQDNAKSKDKQKVVSLRVVNDDKPTYPKPENTSKILYSVRRQYDSKEFTEILDKILRQGQKSDAQHDHVLLKISVDNLPMMMKWNDIEFAEKVMNELEWDLAKLVRRDDVVKRIAFDQFGIILQDQSESEMELFIDKAMRHIQLYNNSQFDEPINVRTSIGSVRFPSFAHSAEDAMDKAFLAMTSARSKSAEFYCDYLDAKKDHLDTKDQMHNMNILQQGLSESRMQLAYQPIVDSKDGKITRHECLLRIKDDGGNVRTAGPLIPIAEKMGVVDIVDQFVLERIIEDLAVAKDSVLAFNVSNLTTDNPKWLKMCSKMLQDSTVADRIIVEVTETAAQHDMRQTAYFVAALQSLGCRVALDDFGAGYTSFRQLKSLSVDMVKIDGSYILNLAQNSDDQIFVKTLIEFAHSYGLETVAEMVENGEVAKLLMNMGVDYMQGYYFGAPDISKPWLK